MGTNGVDINPLIGSNVLLVIVILGSMALCVLLHIWLLNHQQKFDQLIGVNNSYKVDQTE